MLSPESGTDAVLSPSLVALSPAARMFNRKLLEILVCPVSKAPLVYRAASEELWCPASGLAYAITDGIPVLIAEEARELSAEERETLREGR